MADIGAILKKKIVTREYSMEQFLSVRSSFTVIVSVIHGIDVPVCCNYLPAVMMKSVLNTVSEITEECFT